MEESNRNSLLVSQQARPRKTREKQRIISDKPELRTEYVPLDNLGIVWVYFFLLQNDNYDPIGLATDSSYVFFSITYLKAAVNTIVPRSPFLLSVP